VITIKPGFVDTPMTAAFRKGVLWAQPERIARGIVRALERKRVRYTCPGSGADHVRRAVSAESVFIRLSL